MPDAHTHRLTILQAIVARLEAIRVENTFTTRDGGTDHYRTDAGDRVFLYEVPELGEGDPINAIAVLVDDSDPVLLGGFIEEPLIVEIQALAKADVDPQEPITLSPAEAAEELLGDIRRAIEQPNRTLDSLIKGEMRLGALRVIPRDPGRTTVGLSQRYEMSFVRTWGQP